MVRLREDAANNETSSRDGQMRESKRETTDDEENKRSARQPSFGAKNTDEKDEDITRGSDTSHNEYEVQSQTKSGSLSSSYDDESSEAETIDTQNVETDKKNTDSNQHILRAKSNARFGSSSIRLGSLLSQDVDQQTDSATRRQPDELFSSKHQDRRHQAFLKERHDEHDAHYMKPEKAADATEAAMSHSPEDDWQLVQKKGGVHKQKPRFRPQGLSRIPLCDKRPPPALRPSMFLSGRSAGDGASQNEHGSGSPPIHRSQNTQFGACLSATRQSGESGNDAKSGACLSATRQPGECGNDANWNQTIEASKISAILDVTTRQKRSEVEASDLHKARVASLTPDSSLPDQSLAGSSDSEYDTTLNNDYCPSDLEITVKPTTGARSVPTVHPREGIEA